MKWFSFKHRKIKKLLTFRETSLVAIGQELLLSSESSSDSLDVISMKSTGSSPTSLTNLMPLLYETGGTILLLSTKVVASFKFSKSRKRYICWSESNWILRRKNHQKLTETFVNKRFVACINWLIQIIQRYRAEISHRVLIFGIKNLRWISDHRTFYPITFNRNKTLALKMYCKKIHFFIRFCTFLNKKL